MEAAKQDDTPQEPTTRLVRELSTLDAVFVGLGAMLGAGVFVAFAPAAQAAGTSLLVGLAVAAFVAYCNATSSAQLAALYPESGGTYVYASKRLGPLWGYLAGWGFVIGKIASCSAMALTFAHYAFPGWERPAAVTAVVVLTGLTYFGVRRTAFVSRILVCSVLATLAFVAGSVAFRAPPSIDVSWSSDISAYGVLQSAGILFFAFAGYARIATLGEEVRDPQRTIPGPS